MKIKKTELREEGYVNNKELLRLLIEFKKNPDPDTNRRIYNELGKNFLNIAINFMNKGNFINYSEDRKQEMISEATYTMVKYLHNYDPERNTSPFSYFTQIAFNAFIRICKKNKIYCDRHCSLDILEKGAEGFSDLVSDGNSDLVQTSVKARK